MATDATHTLAFAEGGPSVRVRELAELGPDDPTHVLGADAEADRTGLQLWSASLVLCHWLVELGDQLRGRSTIELGAGCGLCGIVAAALCGAAPVTLTDLAPKTMANLQHNLRLNQLGPGIACASVLDWREPSTWPAAAQVVLGSDLVYSAEAVPPLLRVVRTLVAPGGVFLYVAPETNRQGEADFLGGLTAAGFTCQVSAVPEAYLRRVMPEASDEEFDALFAELRTRTYQLYCFSAPGGFGVPTPMVQ